MNKLISRLALVSALIALMGLAPRLPAAEVEQPPTEKKATSEKKSGSEKKAPAQPRGTTYRGTVAALDKTAMTLTVTNKSSSRVFQITSDTKLFKQDKPATLADIVVGDVVGGSYFTNAEKLNLLTVRNSGPNEKAAKQSEKKAEAAAKPEKKAEKKSDM